MGSFKTDETGLERLVKLTAPWSLPAPDTNYWSLFLQQTIRFAPCLLVSAVQPSRSSETQSVRHELGELDFFETDLCSAEY